MLCVVCFSVISEGILFLKLMCDHLWDPLPCLPSFTIDAYITLNHTIYMCADGICYNIMPFINPFFFVFTVNAYITFNHTNYLCDDGISYNMMSCINASYCFTMLLMYCIQSHHLSVYRWHMVYHGVLYNSLLLFYHFSLYYTQSYHLSMYRWHIVYHDVLYNSLLLLYYCSLYYT